MSNNLPDHSIGDAVASSKSRLGGFSTGMYRSYFLDLAGSELCSIDRLSTCKTFGVKPRAALITCRHASLLGCVLCVVGVRSQPQMGGITTKPIVARMAHEQFIEDRPVRQNPSKTMGLDRDMVADCKSSVSTTGCACPDPTFIRAASINLGPKAFFDRARIGKELSGLGIIKGHSKSPIQTWGVTPRLLQAVRGFTVSIIPSCQGVA